MSQRRPEVSHGGHSYRNKKYGDTVFARKYSFRGVASTLKKWPKWCHDRVSDKILSVVNY